MMSYATSGDVFQKTKGFRIWGKPYPSNQTAERLIFISLTIGQGRELGQGLWCREGLYGFAPPEGSLLELGRGDL
jgi:hypothetical protein